MVCQERQANQFFKQDRSIFKPKTNLKSVCKPKKTSPKCPQIMPPECAPTPTITRTDMRMDNCQPPKNCCPPASPMECPVSPTKQECTRNPYVCPVTPEMVFKLVFKALRSINCGDGGTACEVVCYIKKFDRLAIEDPDLMLLVKQSLKKGVCLGILRRNYCTGRYYIARISSGRCKRMYCNPTKCSPCCQKPKCCAPPKYASPRPGGCCPKPCPPPCCPPPCSPCCPTKPCPPPNPCNPCCKPAPPCNPCNPCCKPACKPCCPQPKCYTKGYQLKCLPPVSCQERKPDGNCCQSCCPQPRQRPVQRKPPSCSSRASVPSTVTVPPPTPPNPSPPPSPCPPKQPKCPPSPACSPDPQPCAPPLPPTPCPSPCTTTTCARNALPNLRKFSKNRNSQNMAPKNSTPKLKRQKVSDILVQQIKNMNSY